MSHKLQMHVLSTRCILLAAIFTGTIGLSGCSTNDSGRTVTIVNSQDADSQTTDFGIAYVKRTVPPKGTTDDLKLRRPALPSADLFLRNPTVNGGAEVNITAPITSTAPKGTFYDIKDVDVSSDGTRIIFAMRGPIMPKQKDFNPPNWNIYEYVVAQNLLHPLLPDSDPQGTQSQYISPHYLPDGRILFATTRQVGANEVLLNEGLLKPQFEGQTEDLNESAFVLHVMGSAGEPTVTGVGMHQITYNPSHDVDATVLQSGRVLWSRWDHANGVDGFNLYTANPDGTDVQLLYGRGSHQTVSTNPGGAAGCPADATCTVQFTKPREMQTGKILAVVRADTDTNFGGDLQMIDVQNFVENNQAIPDSARNAGYSTTALAQQSATQNAAVTAISNGVPLISTGGRYSSGFPLWDSSGRILVTWNECRLQDVTGTILPCTQENLALTTGTAPTLSEAPLLYSVWLFNPNDNTFKPVIAPVEGVFLTDVVALQPRPVAPTALSDSYTDTTSPLGILDIQSVYDWDGAPWSGLPAGGIAQMAQTNADARPARFLRLEKAVAIPSRQTYAFDQQSAFGAATNYMREILGYVPIEPDGSVRVTVPANVAFQVSIVDANGRRLFPLHRAWMQVMPGETLKCNGCHTPPAQQPQTAGVSSYSHGRAGVFTPLYTGLGGNGVFPRTTVKACAGETMAEARYGYNCGSAANPSITAATLSVNIVFSDPWFGGGAGNEPIQLSYDDPSFTTPLPTSQTCALANGWNAECRVVINYHANIQALWDKDRGANTCVNCHTGAAATAGYLDLADGASTTDAGQDNAYSQLLQGFSIAGTDASTGQPNNFSVRGPEFISGDARDSHFFQFFATDSAHNGRLSSAEIRLLSEWVDIGAQYYNNPFAAPKAN
jgi:hypothetical protein